MDEYEIPKTRIMGEKGSYRRAGEFLIQNEGKSFNLEQLQTTFSKSIFTNMLLRKYLIEKGFKLRQNKVEGITLLWAEKVTQTKVVQ